MRTDDMETFNKLRTDLKPFPHVLQLDVILTLSLSKCQDILDRILTERNTSKQSEDETLWNDNFMSLLYFRLNKIENCLELNFEVCKQNPTNINGLVTSAYIHFASGFEYEQKKAITELNKLTEREDYKDLLAIGEAEQAYALSRIGPKYYLKSVELFEKAISQLPGKYLWKSGCALTYSRCLDIGKCVGPLTSKDVQQFIESSITYYEEIISYGPSSLKAVALVKLGQLRHSLNNPNYPVTPDIVRNLQLIQRRLDPENLFRRALAMDISRTDSFVLSLCAKFLRYVGSGSFRSKLQESYSLLLEAYEIRQTCFICDQFASVLISMVEQGCTPEGIPCGGGGQELASGRSDSLEMEHRVSPHSRTSSSSSNQRADRFMSRTEVPIYSRLESRHSGNRDTIQHLDAGLDSNTDRMSNMPNRYECHPKYGPNAVKGFYRASRYSTVKARFLPYTPLVDVAIGYLQESIEISKQTNKSAMHKLGVIYRRLAKHDLAKGQFRQIISDRDSSTYDKVNAYEQLGCCLLNSSVNGNYSKEKQAEFIEESKFMLTRCIEEAAKAVARIPSLASADVAHWEWMPTLKKLLTEPSNVQNIHDFARLSELVGEHGESLDFYRQLQRVNPEDPDALYTLIKSYMRQQDFRNALACLHIFKCTKVWRQMIELNPDMVDQVYLEIVRSLLMLPRLSDVDRDTLQDCCQGLFEHRFDTISTGDTRDVFILDDPQQTENEAAYLYSWLKDTCGLSVSRNDEEVPGYSSSFHREAMYLANSSCLLVVLGEKTTSRIEKLVCIGQSDDNPAVIATVKTSDNELPAILKGNSSLLMLGDSFKSDSQGDMRLQCLMLLLGLDYKTFSWLG